eukprot:8265253-Pyramimonas_sp.AAC.1
MEKNNEDARCHTSLGPSYRSNPQQNSPGGLASGVDLTDAETIEYEPAEALRRAVLDSDEDLEDEMIPESGGLGRGRGSFSARSTGRSPDAARPAR